MPEILNCLIKIFADKPTVYTAVQFDERRRLLENSVDQLVLRTYSSNSIMSVKFYMLGKIIQS